MALVDAIDTYYSYIVKQMATVAPSQSMSGYIAARDFPLTPPVENSLYLLFISATPVGGTEAQTLYQFLCQWNWLIIGTNIQANQQAENRGDRFRTNMGIISNLKQASYPGFCLKNTYAVGASGNVIGTNVIQAGVGTTESIWWSRPQFTPKQDNQKTGLIYGTATVRLYCFDDVLTSVE